MSPRRTQQAAGAGGTARRPPLRARPAARHGDMKAFPLHLLFVLRVFCLAALVAGEPQLRWPAPGCPGSSGAPAGGWCGAAGGRWCGSGCGRRGTRVGCGSSRSGMGLGAGGLGQPTAAVPAAGRSEQPQDSFCHLRVGGRVPQRRGHFVWKRRLAFSCPLGTCRGVRPVQGRASVRTESLH